MYYIQCNKKGSCVPCALCPFGFFTCEVQMYTVHRVQNWQQRCRPSYTNPGFCKSTLQESFCLDLLTLTCSGSMEHAKCACSAQSLMCLVFLPAMDQWLVYIIITSKHPSVGGTGRQFYFKNSTVSDSHINFYVCNFNWWKGRTNF